VNRFLVAVAESTASQAAEDDRFDEILLWTLDAPSTFMGAVDPYLKQIGNINPVNLDLARVAAGVLAADRSVPRRWGGSDWNARTFEITVQVAEPERWSAAVDDLNALISFLSGDHWTIQFIQAPECPDAALAVPQTGQRALLFSGGADSAAGALVSAIDMGPGSSQTLVSHYGPSFLAPLQRRLLGNLRTLAPNRTIQHVQVHLNRGSQRLDGTRFHDEPSTRSRSLLFIALGLAVADSMGTQLWIAENGFASLNPPLGADRRGSLSTRTTHPWYLFHLQELITRLGGHADLTNPFRDLTKGEMFREVSARIGPDAAAPFLSESNSCAHTHARFLKAPAGSSCGVCFGCLVRRAAFIAADIADQTHYLCLDTTGRYDTFIAGVSIVEQMRDFVARGVTPTSVMAMSLPDGYSASAALDLGQRGVEELKGLFR